MKYPSFKWQFKLSLPEINLNIFNNLSINNLPLKIKKTRGKLRISIFYNLKTLNYLQKNIIKIKN